MRDEHDAGGVAIFSGHVANHSAGAVDPSVIVAEPLHLAARKFGNVFLFAGHAGDADEFLGECNDLGFFFVRGMNEICVHSDNSKNLKIYLQRFSFE
jgi:hypothetical protein